ncbi:MAG: porin family protein [Bacteroidota bacterium]
MKKVLLTLCAATTVAAAANAQVGFAPALGLNISDYSIKSSPLAFDTKPRIGMRVGAMLQFGLTENVYLQPGLFYAMNGFRLDFLGVKATYNINTLEIPINVVYKFGEPGDNRFFIGAGPYFGINMGGKEKTSGYPDLDLPMGSDSSDFMKPLDIGLGFAAGYEFANGFQVRANTQFGLANLMPIGNSDNSIKSFNYGVTIAYMLGDKGAKKKKMKTTTTQ